MFLHYISEHDLVSDTDYTDHIQHHVAFRYSAFLKVHLTHLANLRQRKSKERLVGKSLGFVYSLKC